MFAHKKRFFVAFCFIREPLHESHHQHLHNYSHRFEEETEKFQGKSIR